MLKQTAELENRPFTYLASTHNHASGESKEDMAERLLNGTESKKD
uniref:Uncharacterized protein n=1 Tax=Candidatus Kentrum sp. TUN TaxID=2126343 RepID=A0A450ZI07_9GAMM|nr:MAG: hypothetical protein BECKTUN1418F_GA0071002_10149 [Candidatus Kentron sp. TUN]VFK53445.1 MAG: hypothetical protein BECKTUN1418E_GA0071001_10169 [Candidatus Kentron sp. TUN]VFK59967.1 MAG: hypothetical protein BECKTUN1418D_GA0071000_11127 [Candidatus Kentron sp. TUN]